MKFSPLFKTVAAAYLALFIGSALIAVAGQVYDRTTKAIVSSGRWTNTVPYAAIALKRIWIDGNTAAAGTVTVTRVTSDSAYTQAVGSVTCTSGAGSTASFTAAYLAPNDMLNFVEGAGSNCTAIIEYENQKH